MHRRHLGAAALVCLLLAAAIPRTAAATPIAMSLAGTGATSASRAAIPACTAALQGFEFWVTDLASASSCASGGGSAKAYCYCDGTTYQARAADRLAVAGGSMSGPIAMGASKITGLGAPAPGSSDAARHADIPFACGSASACARVEDTNGDGDIAPELQAAINGVLWPSGSLTTAKDVYLVAPKQGAYNLASRIVICGDTSPPSGAAAPDCTGNTQQLPRVHFVGAWSAAKLVCTMAAANVVNHQTPCIQIGDAWGDSGDFGHNVPLAFDSPLTIRIATVGTGADFVGGLWCNGCTGELRAVIDANTDGFNWPGFAAVIAGGWLHSTIRADSTSAFGLPTVVFDGQQKGSSASVVGSGISMEIGGGASANPPRWGPLDGCDYNSFSGECDDLHILADTRIAGSSGTQSQLEIMEAEQVVVEGSYIQLSGTGKPAVEIITGTQLTSGTVSPVRHVDFRGTCRSGPGSLNSCIRLFGNNDPAWTPTVVVDGPIVSDVTATNADRAGVGCNHDQVTKPNTKIIIGPNASMRNTAGGNGNLLNTTAVWIRGREVCDATGAVSERRVVRIPSQTLGASPPYCADLANGTWRSCSDERTKWRRTDWAAIWAQSVRTQLYGAAAATTSCNVRLVRNGADPAGSPEASNYWPNGYSFRVGGDGLKASGDAMAFNVAESGSSSDYWQIQVTDDYSNVGGQEACLTAEFAGYASANDDTTHLTDSSKTFTGMTLPKRLVLEAGQGALATRTIDQITSATRLRVSSAFPATTYGSDNMLRTKYRVVPNTGACVCASETLPEMDVTLDFFQVNQ